MTLRGHLLRHPESVKATIEITTRNECVLAPAMNGPVLWREIALGSLSLLEETKGQHRLYLVIDGLEERALKRQPLSTGELHVIEHSTAGVSTKAIAHALGISSSMVSQRLGSAALKIGAASRTELVRLAAALLQREPAAALLQTEPAAATSRGRLTEAELAVLVLLREGLTNEQIAAARSRSVRTIANQVAALLRKTRAPTRRSLAIRCDLDAPRSR